MSQKGCPVKAGGEYYPVNSRPEWWPLPFSSRSWPHWKLALVLVLPTWLQSFSREGLWDVLLCNGGGAFNGWSD